MDKIEPQRDNWHLDKRVPIALIATILFQSACVVGWAYRVDERVAQIEAWRGDQEASQRTDTEVQGEIKTRLSVLESQNTSVIKSLEKIEDKIDAIYRRGIK